MMIDVDDDTKAALRDAIARIVGDDALRDLRIEPYIDHNGEDALRFTLVVSADQYGEVDRLSVMSRLADMLAERHLDLFPYTSLLREGEAA